MIATARSTRDCLIRRDIRDCPSSIGKAPRSGHALSRCASQAVELRSKTELALESNLPPSVASAMMRIEQVTAVVAVHLPSVAIAFLYIAGFSVLRGSLAPSALCNLLRRLFGVLESRPPRDAARRRAHRHRQRLLYRRRQLLHRSPPHSPTTTPSASPVSPPPPPRPPPPPPPPSARLLAGMRCGAVCSRVVGAHAGRKHGHAVDLASRMQSRQDSHSLIDSANGSPRADLGHRVASQPGRACVAARLAMTVQSGERGRSGLP